MSRRFQFSFAIFAGAICFAAIAFLSPAVPDDFLSVPAESRRAWLAKLYRLRTNRQFQFSLRSLLVLATAAPFALWVMSWQCEDVFQWIAMSVLVAVVFLLLKL
ncbi:MAG TPA: hypothetical protein VG125_27395 [Pirellulales bacterium]|jgi:hypothetical protein|nr:hypothetical protein [Pirellulales bacterium]